MQRSVLVYSYLSLHATLVFCYSCCCCFFLFCFCLCHAINPKTLLPKRLGYAKKIRRACMQQKCVLSLLVFEPCFVIWQENTNFFRWRLSSWAALLKALKEALNFRRGGFTATQPQNFCVNFNKIYTEICGLPSVTLIRSSKVKAFLSAAQDLGRLLHVIQKQCLIFVGAFSSDLCKVFSRHYLSMFYAFQPKVTIISWRHVF